MSVMIRLLLFALMSPKGTPAVPPCVRARGQEKRRGDRGDQTDTCAAGEPGAFLDPGRAPAHGIKENPDGDARAKGAVRRMHFAGQRAPAGGSGGFRSKHRVG